MYYRRYRRYGGYRRGPRKKKIPIDDLTYLGYDELRLSELINKNYKELKCSKCSDKINLQYYDIKNHVRSGPYGLYFDCLKCKQNSPLKIKFDIESDERIKLLNEQINYFHSILPKVKKNFNKIQKRINANSEKISKLNKPFYDLEEGYVSEIKKIYTEIDKLRHIDRNNLLEDVAELINIKEPKYTTYAYLEPEVFIHDNL